VVTIAGRLYCSELPSDEQDEQDDEEEDAIMEVEYQRLVASRGEAEPLWVEKFGGAIRVASSFRPQRNRRPSEKALRNIEYI
jgi:hypothetical protein